MKKILLGLFILCSLPSLAYIHIDEAVSIIREKLGPKTMISHISAKQLGVDGYLTENTIVNIRYVPYEDRSSFVSLSMSDVINELEKPEYNASYSLNKQEVEITKIETNKVRDILNRGYINKASLQISFEHIFQDFPKKDGEISDFQFYSSAQGQSKIYATYYLEATRQKEEIIETKTTFGWLFGNKIETVKTSEIIKEYFSVEMNPETNGENVLIRGPISIEGIEKQFGLKY